MKSLKASLLILTILSNVAPAFAKSSSGGGGGSCGRCVNDNCQSCCDIGNTIWGTPGQIQACTSVGNWTAQTGVCPDSRLGAANAATKYVRGGEDSSTQRCWRVACKDDGAYFIGNSTTKIVDTSTCRPCDGTVLKKVNVGKAGTDGNSQITFNIVNRA
ncbi:MAG: hypothetical protein LBQ49_00010 [Rickettsiales bacterium]|jgi:hypothetical protein|nr:hypothetical protein [Rickettsiales bacterium]